MHKKKKGKKIYVWWMINGKLIKAQEPFELWVIILAYIGSWPVIEIHLVIDVN